MNHSISHRSNAFVRTHVELIKDNKKSLKYIIVQFQGRFFIHLIIILAICVKLHLKFLDIQAYRYLKIFSTTRMGKLNVFVLSLLLASYLDDI